MCAYGFMDLCEYLCVCMHVKYLSQVFFRCKFEIVWRLAMPLRSVFNSCSAAVKGRKREEEGFVGTVI